LTAGVKEVKIGDIPNQYRGPTLPSGDEEQSIVHDRVRVRLAEPLKARSIFGWLIFASSASGASV
jgi:hypothetical protein